MMLTADGRQNEVATPAKPRNTIIWVLESARPQARVKQDCRKQPIRNMGREPTTSAMEPIKSNVQPQVRE